MKILLKILLICTSQGIHFVFAQCPSPEVPENGRLVTDTLPNSTTINYECDPGFILVGVEKRICQSNGAWSGTTPICAFNVALHKPAIQSSTRIDVPKAFHANYSTDGNFEGSCSSTVEEKISWWQVDLLEIHRIFAVELMIPSAIGRDTNNEQKIHILTSTTDDFSAKSKTASLCYKHDGILESNRLHTFICIKETKARFVRIVARNAAVHLCEVVVLSSSVASEWQCASVKNMQIWGAFGQSCYYGSYETAPWFVARNRCSEIGEGGSLSVEINANLQQFFISQIRSRSTQPPQFYWIGISNVNNEWSWINGKPLTSNFWADSNAKDVAFSSISYGATLTEPFQWNWMPSLQAIWYNYICQSPIKFCSSPGVPLNGGVMTSGQMRTVGSTIFYYCNKGYSISGDKNRVCQENGVWSSLTPMCSPVDCGQPDVYYEVRIKFLNETKTTLGSVVEFECPQGQKLIGTQSRTCQFDAKWSGKPPKCEDLDCSFPEQLEHGKVVLVQNSTVVGTIAEYSCDGGFGLTGAAVRHCSSSGTWLPAQVPICTDLNTLQSALGSNGFSKHQTSLMTGFIVAIVILLIVLFLVVFWIWKKKKLYDTFSMSTLYGTNSQLNVAASVGCGQDVLYAFPSTVTTAVSLKGSSHYYPPSSLSSASIARYGAAFENNGDEPKSCHKIEPSSLRSNDFRPISNAIVDSTPTDDVHLNADKRLYLSDSIKKREIDRVLKDMQLILPPTPTQRSSITSDFHQFTWKKSNVVEYVRQKWTDIAASVDTLRKIPHHLHISSKTSTNNEKLSTVEQKRPPSPTLSELFSFDDDNGVDVDSEEIYSVVGDLRNSIENSSISSNSFVSVNPCSENNFVNDSTRKLSRNKIYDVPPDAASRLNDNLARVLLKQEKIYDTPCDVVASSTMMNADDVIETVHTYC